MGWRCLIKAWLKSWPRQVGQFSPQRRAFFSRQSRILESSSPFIDEGIQIQTKPFLTFPDPIRNLLRKRFEALLALLEFPESPLSYRDPHLLHLLSNLFHVPLTRHLYPHFFVPMSIQRTSHIYIPGMQWAKSKSLFPISWVLRAGSGDLEIDCFSTPYGNGKREDGGSYPLGYPDMG